MSGFNPFRNRFPYTNLNDINLDWLIKKVRKLSEDVAAINPERIEEVAQQATAAQQDAETALEAAQSAETAATTLSNSKADKVRNATSGNFAALDANGNLIDSGYKNSDYAAFALGISGASAGDFVKIAAVDASGKPTSFDTGAAGSGDVTADMLAVVINGNTSPVGADVGQYVVVKNSTINNITDGLYTAALAIPANTAIDSTYLAAVNYGGFNDLQNKLEKYAKSSGVISLTPAAGFSVESWGALRYYWRGNVGFLYASGLRSTSDISAATEFASGVPFSASYFLYPFPVQGAANVGRVSAYRNTFLISNIPANTDIFFGFSFPLDIS